MIPSATEIVAALGLANQLVGRSHECDYPAGVQALPVCTRPRFDPVGNSREVHERVDAILREALSVYAVDLAVLDALKPTHILTQAQCEVCAVSLADVEKAVAQLSGVQPHILSLQPNHLIDVWADIERVAAALEVEGIGLVQQLRTGVEICSAQAQAAGRRPQVACIEWTDPLMAAGNWIPELVELAGGHCLFGTAGRHSPWLDWADLWAADPEVIVFMPCGYDLQQTREAACDLARRHDEWAQLSAVKSGEVYLVDGNQYFNRPGPRLVDSLAILAQILHPERFAREHPATVWARLL
ncbi:periplasmic binding protein [Gloeobacter kilaueensis JS1]|uniref:Periplasmic binding protein n=1 Tax=Gloeobacter kilaueensis (strain ATCC BAA-2537 / CCAP 1431/1 / ULC 316 / JS1) TaxID=1183438 RepID=U5QGN3_GLOK1|nr:cobalamin-binding protein [Gloeobacter kilaueensis]AGY58132.1 periplasmic binding protein [Gloeobacter kilaueensis JS1]